MSSLASHSLPYPSQSALAGHRIRFSAKRNDGADAVSAVVDDNAVVRQGRGCRTVVAITQRQPTRANATGHRTSIPFGHHAIPKTLAVADSLALSEPPDICRPNGISVSQVYGVTEAWVSDSAFPCEFGIPFGVSSLASHRLLQPSLPALASHRMRFSAKRNGGAKAVSASVDDNAVGRQGRGCRMCSGRHPTTARMRKRYRIPHLHSVWPPRHIENACRYR